jgi:hypothetical protein
VDQPTLMYRTTSLPLGLLAMALLLGGDLPSG